MQSIIINFFSHVIHNNPDTINLISRFKGKLFFDQESGLLVFTLPALHQFLNLNRELKYSQFKKMIYQSSINEELRFLAAKIEIKQTSDNHNETMFILHQDKPVRMN